MTNTTARCDRIIKLIDDCLAEYDATAPTPSSARRAPRDRRRPRTAR